MAVRVAFAALLCASLCPAQAPGLAGVPSGQRAALERGEPVQVLERIANSPWPRSIVYQFIHATPEESAAVLADFELQAKYAPRVRSARIIGQKGDDTDVEYVIDIPVFADERSVNRQRVTMDKGVYRVSWHTVVDSARPGSVSTGVATFMEMRNARTGKLGTLLIHDQSVIPASAFAGVPLVQNKAMSGSRDAAKAIAQQVEAEKASDTRLLASQIARLRRRKLGPH